MAAAFLYTTYLVDEEYTAEVKMYVAPNADEANRSASLSELNYAQAVVRTYIEILRTDSFMQSVAEVGNFDYTPAELRSMVSMSAVNNTEIFRIRVVSSEPEETYRLTQTIAELAPEKIIEIKDADAVRVVDPPIMPRQASGPNLIRNIAVGFALGIVLGFGISLVLELANRRVKNAEELQRLYKLPVLGTVPMHE